MLATVAVFTSLLLTSTAAAAERPCDILGAAGNDCVAAHSTTRALYSSYDGPLYRVTSPAAGNASIDIHALTAGGWADAAAHDKFCAAKDCVISKLFDQSPRGNHLVQRISDGVVHKMVNASRHRISVAGGAEEVYGMWFDPGHGYHQDLTEGVAKVRLQSRGSRGRPSPPLSFSLVLSLSPSLPLPLSLSRHAWPLSNLSPPPSLPSTRATRQSPSLP